MSRPIGSARRLILLWLTGSLTALLLVALGLAAYLWHEWTSPWQSASPVPGQRVHVRIHPGMTLAAASDTLARKELLPSPLVFRLGAKLTGQETDLRAGRFAIPVGVAPRDLLELLVTGPMVQLKVTLPEGIDVEQAAHLVADALSIDAGRFVAVADSVAQQVARQRNLLGQQQRLLDYGSLVQEAGPEQRRRLHWSEGYLAPDTYYFAEGVAAEQVAATMVGLQLSRLETALARAGESVGRLGLHPHDILTLASIVEAEARLDEERPLIAAVYTNRLDCGKRLEADPTVAFALRKKGQRLLYRDLEVESRFNTYRHKGLPPGPIGTPGVAALLAAAAPDTACEALFFVADGLGGHVFSRTAHEHAQAVEQFRKRRRGGDN